MEGPTRSAEDFSFSRLATLNFRQIYAHKLQGFRWVLGLAAALHLTPNFGKLYWHYFTHHTPSILPDFLSFVLSVAARFTWLFLFRDPATFLGFKRPERGYRWAVCGTVVLTTLPNGVVHVWALKMALNNDTVVLAGVWAAILAIVFLLPLVGLVGWMAWRFLLGVEESDEEFEPTAKYALNGTEYIEPYTDHAPSPSREAVVMQGYLAQAYDEQRIEQQELVPDQNIAGPEEITFTEEPQIGVVEESELPSNEAHNAAMTNVTHPLRCQTIARFESMSESHSGPHSWFSYSIFPLVLASYATFLLIGLPIWIHEDRAYTLRDPSSTVKRTLFVPLGLYLLSFYAFKHNMRASLFEHFNVQPPQPWKRMISILPFWFGTGGTFKNLDTGEITVYDPGRRAFPWRAYHQPGLIDTREYQLAFNANPGVCTSYWGHAGRIMKTDFRFRATIHRLGFLFLALYFIIKGFYNTIFYDVPNVYEEVMKHPNTITKDDIARIFRILRLWQTFTFTGLWFVVFALVFGIGCMGSMVVLFLRTVWKYVPQEEKDQIIKDQRERERLQQLEQRRGEGQIYSD